MYGALPRLYGIRGSHIQSFAGSAGFIGFITLQPLPSYLLLLEYLLYITTLATTPYLQSKCLPIVYFVLLISSIALLLTLYQTAKELYIKPINPIGLILFIPFFTYYPSNSIYRRRERHGPDDDL